MKRFPLFALLIALIGIAVVYGGERSMRVHAEQQLMREVDARFSPHVRQLQALIDDITVHNRSLADTVAARPDLDEQALEARAARIVALQPRITSVVVADHLKVRFVSPVRGNEAIVGMDFSLHPEFMRSVQRAIERRATVVDGPVPLLQSGRLGIVFRTPVFDAQGDFQGSVSMAVDLERLLIGAGLLAPAQGYALAIHDQAGRPIFGDPQWFGQRHAGAQVVLPDGRWTLAAVPKTDAVAEPRRVWAIRVCAGVLTLLLEWWWWRRAHLRAVTALATAGTRGSLRVVMLLLVLVAIPVMVGLSTWVAFRTSMRVAEQLEQQQVSALATQLRDKITGFFEIPRRVAIFNVEQFHGGMLDPHDQDTMRRNFLLQLRQQPLLTFLSMGTAEGEYYAASRPPRGDDRALRLLEATRAGQRLMMQYKVDDANHRSTLLSVGDQPFDARVRPWFKAASAASGVLWYAPYRYAVQDSHHVYDALGMGMSAPLYDAEHRFVGVVTADVALSQLSSFLATQVDAFGGTAFLAETDGTLLASSTEEAIYRLDGDETLRVRSVDSDHPVLRLAGRAVEAAGQPAGFRLVELEGARHLVSWETITLPNGPDLVIALTLPESRFAGPASEALRHFMVLTLFLVVAAGLGGLLATHALARPLLALSRWARQLARGEWHQPPPTDSRIEEIHDLTEALTDMAGHLRRHTADLEQRVAERTAELEAANRQLEALSVTDALTGIANRRHFDRFLSAEWRRAQRHAQTLALMIVDVDLFKYYNDRYGHQAGDEALRCVAQTLAAKVRRSGELAARYGGEEFAIVAAGQTEDGAWQLAETLRAAVEALAIPHLDAPWQYISVSIGVAVAQPGRPESHEALLKQADEALYRAKRNGRNRVACAWSEDPPAG